MSTLHGKTDLIAELAEMTELPHQDVRRILDALTDSVNRTLRAGDRAKVPGIGILAPVHRLARCGTGPDGKPYAAPPSVRIAFRPAKRLRDVMAAAMERMP